MRIATALLLALACIGCDSTRDETQDNRVGLVLFVPNAFRVTTTFEDDDLDITAQPRGLLCTGGLTISIRGDNGEDELDASVFLTNTGSYPQPGTYSFTPEDGFSAQVQYTGTRLPGFDEPQTTIYEGTEASLTVTESGERFSGTLQLAGVGGDVTAEVGATFSIRARREGC